jgi:hypothetical protein
MSVESWDPDQALLLPVEEDTDEEPVSPPVRYGVTGWESSHQEPLSSALAAEVPDRGTSAVDDVGVDDEWVEVDDDARFPGRLLADAEPDDDYAVAVEDLDDYAPEERAMHTVEA